MSEKNRIWANFEDDVYAALRDAVSSHQLPFDGSSNIKIKRSPEYRAIASGSTIKIEVSLEAFRREATEPFLIWLWECKHKDNREVEVGVVRELHSKMIEMGVGRTKGSVVTTIGFQSGAIRLAESIGISLYILKKELVAITKYAKNTPDELREVIYAYRSFEFTGKERTGERFEDLIRLGFQQAIDETE